MKLYHSLSDAVRAFKRKSKEVFAIISFNNQAYFVFRSNPDAETSTIMQAHLKILIGNELKNQEVNKIDNIKKEKVYNFMVNANVPTLFQSKSHHAEENLINGFDKILRVYEEIFLNKISKIDIILTHSPCSSNGIKKYSNESNVNGFFLPAGCNEKLSVFFNKHYKVANDHLFCTKTKVNVYYIHKFDSNISYDSAFIKKADPILENVISLALSKGSKPNSSYQNQILRTKEDNNGLKFVN